MEKMMATLEKMKKIGVTPDVLFKVKTWEQLFRMGEVPLLGDWMKTIIREDFAEKNPEVVGVHSVGKSVGSFAVVSRRMRWV